MGKFNFKDDKIEDMVQAFYSKLESVLQSSKFDNLRLNDPFNLQIKVLGKHHMKEIREKQEKEEAKLRKLNIPNYGLDKFFRNMEEQRQNFKMQDKTYFFEVPRTHEEHHIDMENCFMSNCLILSIIIGRLTIVIQTYFHLRSIIIF